MNFSGDGEDIWNRSQRGSCRGGATEGKYKREEGGKEDSLQGGGDEKTNWNIRRQHRLKGLKSVMILRVNALERGIFWNRSQCGFRE